jgi:hypothetical protein
MDATSSAHSTLANSRLRLGHIKSWVETKIAGRSRNGARTKAFRSPRARLEGLLVKNHTIKIWHGTKVQPNSPGWSHLFWTGRPLDKRSAGWYQFI